MGAKGTGKLQGEIGSAGQSADDGATAGQQLAQQGVQPIAIGMAGQRGEKLGIAAIMVIEDLGEDLIACLGQELGGLGLVENGEARRHSGLDRKRCSRRSQKA